jgi:hypothetical protein
VATTKITRIVRFFELLAQTHNHRDKLVKTELNLSEFCKAVDYFAASQEHKFGYKDHKNKTDKIFAHFFNLEEHSDISCAIKFRRSRRRLKPELDKDGEVSPASVDANEGVTETVHCLFFKEKYCLVQMNKFGPSIPDIERHIETIITNATVFCFQNRDANAEDQPFDLPMPNYLNKVKITMMPLLNKNLREIISSVHRVKNVKYEVNFSDTNDSVEKQMPRGLAEMLLFERRDNVRRIDRTDYFQKSGTKLVYIGDHWIKEALNFILIKARVTWLSVFKKLELKFVETVELEGRNGEVIVKEKTKTEDLATGIIKRSMTFRVNSDTGVLDSDDVFNVLQSFAIANEEMLENAIPLRKQSND